MMFALHREISCIPFLLHPSIFRSWLSVFALLFQVSSGVLSGVSVLLIHEDGVDAI